MLLRKYTYLLIILFVSFSTLGQKDSIRVHKNNLKTKKRLLKNTPQNPLAPSKAAFYSAIFPGMGQIYNKKYWKAPIVWGALAIPTYYYLTNNSEYKRFRTAFRQRKAGLVDEFTVNGVETLSLQTLESAQQQLKENRDLSLLSGVILYVLQIVEASVNAHLLQFNTDDNLSLRPSIVIDPVIVKTPNIGLTINYNF